MMPTFEQPARARNPMLVAALVATLQCAVILYMVWDRTSLLRNGREIVLDVVPVDPRSLFRGDYVILSYHISTIDPKLVTDAPEQQHSGTVYITLAQDGTAWKAVAASRARPAAPAAGHLVLKGRARHWSWPRDDQHPLRVAYGIESYFVPEGKGLELEKMVGEKKIRAIVAVGRDGTAAIKGLELDGRRIYDTPLL